MASPPGHVSKPKSAPPPAPPQWEAPVNCVLCDRELKDPHLLACFHCLCRECLPRAAREDGRIKCPSAGCGDCSTTWRQPDAVTVPRCEARLRKCLPVQCATVGRYVEGKKILRKVASGDRITCGNPNCDTDAEAAAFCSDCWLFFCSSCRKSHKLMEAFIGKHVILPISSLRAGSIAEGSEAVTFLCKVTPLCCPRHNGKVLEYHCEVCDLLMCQACTVGKDSPHHPAYFGADVTLHSRNLRAVELAKKVASCNKEECRIAKIAAEEWGTEVERNEEEALRAARQSFQAIRAAIDDREETLCEKIRAVSLARKESVANTIHLYRQKEDTLSNKHAMLSFLSTSGSPHEVVSYCRMLDAGKTHRKSEAVVSRVMHFLPKQEAALQAAIEGFGDVEVGACPANCILEPAPTKVRRCSDNDPIVLTLTTANRKKTLCNIGGEMVKAFLRPRPPTPGPPIKAAVNDEGNGQYKVTFDLTYTGECELSVLVNGAHIHDSPFAVGLYTTDMRLMLTRDINTQHPCKGTLQFPNVPGKLSGVAVAPNGNIFVTDADNHQIHVFDTAQKFIRSFGVEGEDDQLKRPMCITVTSEALLYIANGKKVDVLSYDGVLKKRIGAGRLLSSFDVTVHKGEIFVADFGNDHVVVFSQENKFVRTIGTTGTGPGRLRRPSGVAISPDGELYVSDCNNHRVQVFTTRGKFIKELGNRHGMGAVKLQLTSKHVLVADSSNNRIAVFNHDGKLITFMACADAPRGLAIDLKGNLLVACYDGKCVEIF